MKSTFAVLAAAASLSQVTATFHGGFHNAPPFSCPGNQDNVCEDKQHGGYDWSDLPSGHFEDYDGFKWNGWTCEDSFSRRDLLAPRTFDGKVISGSCGPDPSTAPSFECGPQRTGKNFSVKQFEITVEYDTRLEFHYDMPDGSVCRHQQDCSTGGTTVHNTQCGGATKVRFVQPPQPNQPKPNCHIGVHHIGFDCDDNTPPRPPYTPPTPPAPPTTSEEVPVETTTSEELPVETTSEEIKTTTAPAEETTTSAEETKTTESSEAPVTTSSAEETTTSPAEETSTVPAEETSTSPAEETSTVPAEETSTVPAEETSTVPAEETSTVPAEITSVTESTSGVETKTTESSEAPVTTTSPAEETPITTEVSTVITTTYETISTIFTTSVQTITSCAPDVPNCPGRETTVTVPVTVTTCPVTETITTGPSQTPSVPAPGGDDEEELPCDEVVPKCLNTFFHLVESCKDNTDSECYCPNQEFITEVYKCVYAHGATDDIIGESINFLQGVCAPAIPQNPGIVTGADSVTEHITITGTITATSVAYTTVQVDATVTEPCVSDGTTIPGSSTVITISTQVTVPEVTLPTATATATEGGELPGSPAPTTFFTQPPAGTGEVTVPTSSIFPPPSAGNSVRASLGLGMIVMVAAAALL